MLRSSIPSPCLFGKPRVLPLAEKSGMLRAAPESCGFPTQARYPRAVCACDFLSYIGSHTRGCVLTQGALLTSVLAVGAVVAVVTIAFTGLRCAKFAVVVVGPNVTSLSVPTLTTEPTAISLRRRSCASSSSITLKKCVGCVGGSSPYQRNQRRFPHVCVPLTLRSCDGSDGVPGFIPSLFLRSCASSCSTFLEAYKACRCAHDLGGRHSPPPLFVYSPDKRGRPVDDLLREVAALIVLTAEPAMQRGKMPQSASLTSRICKFGVMRSSCTGQI